MDVNGSTLLLAEDDTTIVKNLNLDPDKLEHYMKLFSDWISSQEHLQQNYSDFCRKKFLIWAKLDFEKAKKKFQRYCYNPLTHKEFVCDRILSLDGDLKAFSFCYIAHMPKLTPEGYRVCILKIAEPANYETLTLARCMALTFDYRLHKESLNAGELIMVDLAAVKPIHYAKLFDIAALKFTRFSLLHYPFIVKHILILNCHPLLEKGINLMKSILPQKLADRVALIDSQDVAKYVPPECLPMEYGGTDKSMGYFKEAWIELLAKQKNFLVETGNAKPTGPIPEEFKAYEHEFGVDGSFRKLNID